MHLKQKQNKYYYNLYLIVINFKNPKWHIYNMHVYFTHDKENLIIYLRIFCMFLEVMQYFWPTLYVQTEQGECTNGARLLAAHGP